MHQIIKKQQRDSGLQQNKLSPFLLYREIINELVINRISINAFEKNISYVLHAASPFLHTDPNPSYNSGLPYYFFR